MEESALDFVLRQYVKKVDTGVDFLDDILLGSISQKDVIEITGPSNSAKSSLLHQIVAHFLTKHSARVLYFDHEVGDFDRLVQLTKDKAYEKDRLSVLRCTSSLDFLACLSSKLIQSSSLEKSTPLLIVVDSINAFVERESMVASIAGEGLVLREQCFKKLESIVRDFGAIVIASKREESKESLGSTWNNMVRKRLKVTRVKDATNCNTFVISKGSSSNSTSCTFTFKSSSSGGIATYA